MSSKASEKKRVLTLIDLDELFHNTPGARIINNDTLVSSKFSKEFNDAIYNNCDGDLGFVPTCQCGAVRGVSKEGSICPHCGTVCSTQFINKLSHMAWIGIPDHLPPVLHPVWYRVLSAWSSIGSHNKTCVIDIILDPTLEPPDDLIPFLRGRGFQYFYEHFDEILDVMLTKYPRTAKKPTARSIAVFAKHYRNIAFVRHLPVLHSSLHALKRGGDSQLYADPVSKEIMSAVIDLSAMVYSEHAIRTSPTQRDHVMFTVFKNVMDYYKELVTKKLNGKKALLRQHNFGSRIQWSFRTVITPHTDIRPIDEIVLPWGILLNGLKLQLINLLVSRKYKTVEQALNQIMRAFNNYDQEIDELITAIIDEFPDHKMPVVVGRNPNQEMILSRLRLGA